VALAESVGYRGAGTLEYLYDPADRSFHFIEMNTRIQVEHPVTEMVTGVDLVQAMIRVAFGEPLPLSQEDVRVDGWSIEARINAEDPARGFLPWPGVAAGLTVPAGVRFDTMLYPGYAVPPFYDSLVGKLIVHGRDRADALAKLRAALDGLRIDGLRTTIPLHRALADDPAVIAGEFHTRFLEPWLEANPIPETAA
jgi:acetyl-CoA carboxylase biotin carboxylase subunit